MALRDLVEGECGGANSLVHLSGHMLKDRALKDEGFRHTFPHSDGFSSSSADQLVQQFFEERLGQATPTFRMDSLLAEMRDLERGIGTSPVQSAPISQLAAEQDVSCWAEQYLEAGKHFQESNQDSIWGAPQVNPTTNETFELGFGPNWAQEYLQSNSEHLDLDEPEVNLSELGTSEEYSVDTTEESSELKEVAKDILKNTAEDSRFNYSKFLKFMSQIGEGNMTIENGVVKEVADEFTTSFLKELEDNNLESLNDKWEEVDREAGEKADQEVGDTDKWNEEKLMATWEEASRITSTEGFRSDNLKNNLEGRNKDGYTVDLQPWTNDYRQYLELATAFDYHFDENNSMSDLPDAMAEGLRRKEAGDIPSAVLCFECAVKADPTNASAWLTLATTQAENEQDSQAIAAFKKCLELDENNLDALMGLAVSYTNESYDHHACRALKDWLRNNPKYSDLVPLQEEKMFEKFSMQTTIDLHKETCDKFIAAARRNPHDIDPDVQCGLGVLFNLINEQNKAVDCLKAALQARPNDFNMWNRLGATLANGGRAEEAVDAYHNALQLFPGFIRARYNLGITCTHLGAHREAVEHFLSALTIQASGTGMQGERTVNMSDTIWTTLRLVVSFLDRPDLLQAVNDRDLDTLNREFNNPGNQKS